MKIFWFYELLNQMGLEAVMEETAVFLNKAVNPILVAGPKLRVEKECKAFI